MDHQIVHELSELTMRIRSGQLQGSAAYRVLDSWTQAEGTAADLVHFLYHYVADDDLRVKDKNYGEYQDARLDELLKGLSMNT